MSLPSHAHLASSRRNQANSSSGSGPQDTNAAPSVAAKPQPHHAKFDVPLLDDSGDDYTHWCKTVSLVLNRDAAVWFRTLVRTRTFPNRTKVRSGVRGWGRTGPTVPSGVRGGAGPGGTVQNRVRTPNRKVSMWSGARAPHVELYFCPQSCCLCGCALAHPLVNC